MISDKLLGGTLLLISICIFAYYTIWALILPLLDTKHFLATYFLPHYYAIVLPIGAIIAGIAIIIVVACIFAIRNQLEKKKE